MPKRKKAPWIQKALQKNVLRPFQMLFMEPILLLITMYMGFIYGFLYLSFSAYSIAFQQLRGWSDGVGALPFIVILVGVLVGVIIIIIYSETRFRHIVSGERLTPMMVSGVFLPIGIFWFGWTSEPSHYLFAP